MSFGGEGNGSQCREETVASRGAGFIMQRFKPCFSTNTTHLVHSLLHTELYSSGRLHVISPEGAVQEECFLQYSWLVTGVEEVAVMNQRMRI